MSLTEQHKRMLDLNKSLGNPEVAALIMLAEEVAGLTNAVDRCASSQHDTCQAVYAVAANRDS